MPRLGQHLKCGTTVSYQILSPHMIQSGLTGNGEDTNWNLPVEDQEERNKGQEREKMNKERKKRRKTKK
jgi:hypothetical protein